MAILIASASCARREPLTAALAEKIIRSHAFSHEPVYAEVPQRVWWDGNSPKDDYDEKAIRTLRNLEREGFLSVVESQHSGTTAFVGTVTAKGFSVLGTAPSRRGPCFRALICEKKYDGLRNFTRHPNDPTVAHADIMWHYADPTALYDAFETKIDKPLDTPFASFVSFYYKDHQWRFDVTVKKAAAE